MKNCSICGMYHPPDVPHYLRRKRVRLVIDAHWEPDKRELYQDGFCVGYWNGDSILDLDGANVITDAARMPSWRDLLRDAWAKLLNPLRRVRK